MQHIAIMKKSWDLIPKILNERKTIESRWYQTKRIPFGGINVGDTIYFKNTGEPVTVKASVLRVEEYEKLNPEKISELLDKFGAEGKICFPDLTQAKKDLENKKYCVLIFIKNPQKISPFNIDKTGFGAMSAWISLSDVNLIKTN